LDYKLYIRGENCQLCEHAEEVLREVGLHVEVVDISPHVSLEREYGRRIPVLREEPSGRELAWPFDAWVLRRFLGEEPAGG
jgi:hypothetical protein